MPLHILVVHEFGVTRRIVRDYIMAELSEAIVDVAASPREAAEFLDRKSYDVVLYDMEEALSNEFAVHRHPRGAHTAFIVMTCSPEEEKRARLAGIAVDHTISLPFTPVQLGDMILRICDPRAKRLYSRYVIPRCKAIVDIDGRHVLADVVNISVNGVLCDIDCPEENLNLTGATLIAIQFPVDYGGANTGWVASRLLRLSVTEWRANNSPLRVRAAWRLTDLPETAEKILGAAIEKVREELMAAERKTRKENSEDFG
jgi:CheY-like chemotaxis protein